MTVSAETPLHASLREFDRLLEQLLVPDAGEFPRESVKPGSAGFKASRGKDEHGHPSEHPR